MNWQKELNKLFTDSFFRFLFGFTIIIALSFGVMIVATTLDNGEINEGSAQPRQGY